jgi:hypothetical protein
MKVFETEVFLVPDIIFEMLATKEGSPLSIRIFNTLRDKCVFLILRQTNHFTRRHVPHIADRRSEYCATPGHSFFHHHGKPC